MLLDCAAEMMAFYETEVRLPAVERNEMRLRRDANRRRLLKGLEGLRRPAPIALHSQGSYAMHTMVQYPAKDYDIDDGIYFHSAHLVGPRGAPLTSLDARKLICEACQDGRFNRPPEVRKNCVRIYYEEGYHVDIPVYRVLSDESEPKTQLASAEWRDSDARRVTSWFKALNNSLSPGPENGGQFRRVVSLLKKFASSRGGWRKKILSGFAITKLASECYLAADRRDDEALYFTMRAIRDRLQVDLRIRHPVIEGEELATADDPKSRFFLDKLTTAVAKLDPITHLGCTKKQAFECWDQVFLSSHFRAQAGPEERAPDESFIEELGFSNHLQHNVKIVGQVVKKNGFRSGPLARFTSVGKGRTIIFRVETDTPEPFTLYWKVRNSGPEAAQESCLRGQVDKDDGTRSRCEPTKYEGCHYVEAYVVRDGKIVARTRKMVRIASHS